MEEEIKQFGNCEYRQKAYKKSIGSSEQQIFFIGSLLKRVTYLLIVFAFPPILNSP
jgi:hypothetical protein